MKHDIDKGLDPGIIIIISCVGSRVWVAHSLTLGPTAPTSAGQHLDKREDRHGSVVKSHDFPPLVVSLSLFHFSLQSPTGLP